ncbi:LUD domain-containing protein [Sorangium sp. So ce281]|uniref:LUD domain-containing protein n=1 Tax=unclassified Sorangium TaxID=2621164 RepID=UPI003F5F21F0
MTAAPPRGAPGSSRPAPGSSSISSASRPSGARRSRPEVGSRSCRNGSPPATSTRSLGAFELDSTLARARIDADDFGITRAAGAIAETGTVILDDATTSTRLSALAPWIHVAIVRRADIHRSLCAEISALGGAPYVVRCTGPSKTADVEGILIQGVHGPGEPIALIVGAW